MEDISCCVAHFPSTWSMWYISKLLWHKPNISPIYLSLNCLNEISLELFKERKIFLSRILIVLNTNNWIKWTAQCYYVIWLCWSRRYIYWKITHSNKSLYYIEHVIKHYSLFTPGQYTGLNKSCSCLLQ